MKFTEILEELRKGEKVTREKWENSEAKPYKYITFERGKCIACSEDYTEEGEGASYEGSIFEYDDFTAKDWKIYEKPNQVWQPKRNEKYYFVTSCGNVGYDDFDCYIDENRANFKNAFRTEEEARKILEKIKIIKHLQELSNIKFNDDINQPKFAIYYDTEKQGVSYAVHHINREIPFNIYFKTEEDCQKAIEIIGEENLKKYYFDVED